MKALWLLPKKLPTIPVEAEAISPDIIAGRKLEEVEKLSVHVGNTKQTMGEYFELEGETADQAAGQKIIVNGSIPGVKYVGADMTAGKILVKGSIGMHVGAHMTGGEILIEGSASNWAGAEMKGGLLRIKGNGGHQIGSAYRGSSEGMKGGCILVEGNAGLELGAFIRRGMIVVKGDVDSFAGAHMNGGEIFIFGKAEKRLGAAARGNGGFIACLGEVESLLPTYIYDATYKPTFMKLYLRQMKDYLGINEAENFLETLFRKYRGDVAVGGNSEILIAEKL